MRAIYTNVATPISALAPARASLPVVLPAASSGTLSARLRVAVAEVLLRLGVPKDDVDVEVEKMADVHIAKTASRQVTGVMVDFAKAIDVLFGEESLVEMSVRLASAPCSPLYGSFVSPDRATKARFGERRRSAR